MPDSVARTNPAEDGDSAAVSCPRCNGSKVDPVYNSQCPLCVGTGFLLQQRMDANGRPTRVRVVG